ncbi:MAG: hypothetical protein H6865_04970 [Rhodospirillales bacterium]|nr:hypothetical protein [Alphaproteobacteria bacterium]MCB9986970.1 hypothetical protein [Rhodospirillales bacterium]USO08255.1 MAG: hypothetical protein H6866_03320 [Rhodospirillales bacterium]
MSIDESAVSPASPRAAALADGVLCYLHLWASLRKHVQLADDEIEPDIGLWDDLAGGYFAVFTQDSPKKLRRASSYVCAIGADGPVVGQFDRLPPCAAVKLPREAGMMLTMLARSGPQSARGAVRQIEVVAALIDRALPVKRRKTKRGA